MHLPYRIIFFLFTCCSFFFACNKHHGAAPHYDFSWFQMADSEASFQANAPAGSNCYWDFADGSSGTGLAVTHLYSGYGPFTVKLTVNGDAANAVSKTVTIGKPAITYTGVELPDSTFVFSTNTACAGSFLWSFGDGATAIGTSPNHSYSAAGWYTVTVTVQSATCYTISRDVYVYPSYLSITRSLAGSRQWHLVRTVMHTVDTGNETTVTTVDVPLTIQYLNPGRIIVGPDTLQYAERSADSLIYYTGVRVQPYSLKRLSVNTVTNHMVYTNETSYGYLDSWKYYYP